MTIRCLHACHMFKSEGGLYVHVKLHFLSMNVIFDTCNCEIKHPYSAMILYMSLFEPTCAFLHGWFICIAFCPSVHPSVEILRPLPSFQRPPHICKKHFYYTPLPPLTPRLPERPYFWMDCKILTVFGFSVPHPRTSQS